MWRFEVREDKTETLKACSINKFDKLKFSGAQRVIIFDSKAYGIGFSENGMVY